MLDSSGERQGDGSWWYCRELRAAALCQPGTRRFSICPGRINLPTGSLISYQSGSPVCCVHTYNYILYLPNSAKEHAEKGRRFFLPLSASRKPETPRRFPKLPLPRCLAEHITGDSTSTPWRSAPSGVQEAVFRGGHRPGGSTCAGDRIARPGIRGSPLGVASGHFLVEIHSEDRHSFGKLLRTSVRSSALDTLMFRILQHQACQHPHTSPFNEDFGAQFSISCHDALS